MKNIDIAFYTDIGGRPNNEDSHLNRRMDDYALLVVANGLGGHQAGEVASNIAVKSIQEYIIDVRNEDVVKAVEYANRHILEQQEKTMTKMKTTIALALVKETETIISNVGDTRVYAFKNGKIVFQTMDHSVSQMAVSMGEITREEIRNHIDRNILVRVLGATEDIKVDTVTIPNDQIDALLLCSDGFWEYVLETDMEETLCSCDSARNWLCKMKTIQLNNAPEDCDNNTAIVVMM